MIYGINFGAPKFDEAPFAADFKSKVRVAEVSSWEWYHLVGLCDSALERDTMLSTADNGRRKLHVVEKNGHFGIYAR